MSTPQRTGVIDVLLVEDSPTDALLTREALAESAGRHALHVVSNGVEALRFLRHKDEYATAPTPGLILLDLNLPQMSGFEVLGAMRSDPKLRRIPVIVLTTSAADEDVMASYGGCANCYVRKPMDFGKFTDVVRSVTNFWFGVVTLPPVSSQ